MELYPQVRSCNKTQGLASRGVPIEDLISEQESRISKLLGAT